MNKLVKEGVLSKTGRDTYAIIKQKVVSSFFPSIILKVLSALAAHT